MPGTTSGSSSRSNHLTSIQYYDINTESQLYCCRKHNAAMSRLCWTKYWDKKMTPPVPAENLPTHHTRLSFFCCSCLVSCMITSWVGHSFGETAWNISIKELATWADHLSAPPNALWSRALVSLWAEMMGARSIAVPPSRLSGLILSNIIVLVHKLHRGVYGDSCQAYDFSALHGAHHILILIWQQCLSNVSPPAQPTTFRTSVCWLGVVSLLLMLRWTCIHTQNKRAGLHASRNILGIGIIVT